jgi:hypothetical protein
MSSTVETVIEVRPFHSEVSQGEIDELRRRSWAEKAYPNLIYFNEVDRGNHFAAWQEPALFTSELRAPFRSLR